MATILTPWLAGTTETSGRYAFNQFATDGQHVNFGINFAGVAPGYLARTDVKYYITDLNGVVITPVTVVPSANWNSDTVINMTGAGGVPLPTGRWLFFFRDTQKSQPIPNFNDGSVIDETNLDTGFRQAVYVAAEMVDKFDVTQDNADSAIATALSALAAAQAAVTTANAATVTANAAASTAGSAATTAGSAVTTANAATTTANTALSTANGIDAKASTALSNSATAVTTANSATSTANGIDAKAQSALDASANAVTTANAALNANINAVLKQNNLSELTNFGTARTNLGLGTAAVLNTGVSGGTIPLLNGTNTWSATQTFSVRPNFGANVPWDKGNLVNPVRAAVNTGNSVFIEYARNTPSQVSLWVDASNFGDIVNTGTAQTIAGVKTFSARPIFGTSTTPWDNSNLPNPVRSNITSNNISIDWQRVSTGHVSLIVDSSFISDIVDTITPQQITGAKTFTSAIASTLAPGGAVGNCNYNANGLGGYANIGMASLNATASMIIRCSGASALEVLNGASAQYNPITCSSVTQTSDRALKTDINSYESILDKLRTKRVVTYKFKTPAIMGGGVGVEQVGVIAQEWQEDFPELVQEIGADIDEDGDFIARQYAPVVEVMKEIPNYDEEGNEDGTLTVGTGEYTGGEEIFGPNGAPVSRKALGFNYSNASAVALGGVIELDAALRTAMATIADLQTRLAALEAK